MNDELKQICDAIGALKEGDWWVAVHESHDRYELVGTCDVEDLQTLAFYALRVEKIIAAVHRLKAHWETPKGEWPEEEWRTIHDDLLDALSAFEATQDDSNGRGTQG